MTQKHTPRPWVYTRKMNDAFKVCNDKIDICRVYINYNQAETESESNAALIAAAPDLLEALSNMLDLAQMAADQIRFEVRSVNGTLYTKQDIEEAEELIQQARSAIAKAEGR